MELPHIGAHCSKSNCNQLDFLPLTCPFCKGVFCNDHFRAHTESQDNPSLGAGHVCHKLSDAKTVTCPVCSQIIPLRQGHDPNISVETHIRSGCKPSAAAYTNKCHVPGCKKKEVIRIECSSCHQTFCIQHRLQADHNCAQQTHSSQVKKQTNTNSSVMNGFQALFTKQNSNGSLSSKKKHDSCIIS